jgi:hypothetical protein
MKIERERENRTYGHSSECFPCFIGHFESVFSSDSDSGSDSEPTTEVGEAATTEEEEETGMVLGGDETSDEEAAAVLFAKTEFTTVRATNNSEGVQNFIFLFSVFFSKFSLSS